MTMIIVLFYALDQILDSDPDSRRYRSTTGRAPAHGGVTPDRGPDDNGMTTQILHPEPDSLKTRNIRRPPSSHAPLLTSGAVINLLILVILITFSYLREEPLFWMNEGESPIWLRDLVASYYYPFLLLELLLLSAFSGFSIHHLSSRSSSASLAVILLPMLWGLYFLVIVNSVFNNLENLFLGRPLHWHPDETWRQLGGGPQGISSPATEG